MKEKLKLVYVVKSVSLILLFIYFASVFIFSYSKELYMISHAMFFAFAGMVIFYRIIKISLANSKFYIYITLIIVFSIMSYYWAIDKDIVTETTKTYFSLAMFSVAIINILETEWDVSFALKSLAFAGLAMCIYTVAIYGFDEMLLMMKEGERIGGEINQANTFGMITSLSFAIFIMYAAFEKKWIYYMLSAIPFFCAFTSGSKKVILMIAVTFALLIILNTSSKKVISTVILIIAAMIVWNFLSQSEYFSNTFERFTIFGNIFEKGNNMAVADNSSNIRMNMIKYGWELFLKNPIWGYGTNQFNHFHLENYGWYVYSHCFYIQILTSHGIIGFLIYFRMHYDIIKMSVIHLKSSTNAKIIFSLMIIMAVAAIAAEYSHDKIYFMILGIGFGFINVYQNKQVTKKIEPGEESEEIIKTEEEVTE